MLGVRSRHFGSTIGVLGSGPTLNQFRDKINSLCDIVIACNGSVLALNPSSHTIDYYLYYDWRVTTKDWFGKHQSFYTSQNIPSLLRPLIGKRPKLLMPLQEICENVPISEDVYYYNHRVVDSNHFSLDNNHIIYNYCTVVGVGVQFAYKMGASKICLFGCSFDNDSGRNYAVASNTDNDGLTSLYQRKRMDAIIKKIKHEGIKVISFGKTRLEEPVQS